MADEPKLTAIVTIRIWPNEARVLAQLARKERRSRSQLLRVALQRYARHALTVDEYRSAYPPNED